MRKTDIVLRTAFTLAALAACGRADTVWMGGLSSAWDQLTANWMVDGVAGQKWTPGAATVFDDAASQYAVTISQAVSPGSVVFSNDVNYTLSGPIAGTSGLVKRGSGTLTISDAASSFTGDVLIEGGDVRLTAGNDGSNVTKSGLGNPRADRTITVTNGASLSFTAINTFGGGGKSTQKVRANFRIVDGASLNLVTNNCSSIGGLYLDGGRLTYHGGNVGSCEWGTLTCNGMTFRGAQPYSFPAVGTDRDDSSGARHCGVILGRNEECILDVADLTGNADADVTFGWKVLYCANGPAAGSFTKRGAGTLLLTSGGNQYRGPVRVEEGTLAFSGTDANAGDNSCMGARHVVHTNWVGPNAKISFQGPDLQGTSYNNDSKIVTHVAGGTLEVGVNCNNAVGPVVLENGRLTYSGHKISGYYQYIDGVRSETNINWPTLSFYGGLFCRGTNTYDFPATYSGSNCPIFFFRNSPFHVDDITGDARSDVVNRVRICDMPTWYSSNDNGPYGVRAVGIPASFVKTGAGTLEFVGETMQSLFTGDVTVREGCLKLSVGNNSVDRFDKNDWSPLGNMRVPHTALVCDGAELNLAVSDIFGQHSTPVDALRIVVSNSTLSQASGKCNGFGELVLYNANVVYGGGAGGARHWGIFVLGKKVVFDGDNGVAYDWPAQASEGYMSLGYLTDHEVLNGGLQHRGFTEMCVRDVTRNGCADATIRTILQDQPTWDSRKLNNIHISYCCGLRKTGEGTLRLTNSNIYTGATEVVEGALLVDSPSSRSAVTVKAGGRLGGMGLVPSVTVEPGGGFTAAPDQAAPLTLTTLALPTDSVVALDIACTNDLSAAASYSVPVVRSAGFDGVRWDVTVNGGAAPRNMRAFTRVRDGVVFGCVSRSGLVVFIR